MNINLQLNENDYIKLGYKTFLSNVFNIIWPIMAVIGAFYEFFINPKLNFPLIIFYGLIILAYAYIYFSYIPASAATSCKLSAYSKEPFPLIIDENGVTLEKSNSLIKWSDLYAVDKKKGFVIFYISRGNTIIIPSRFYSENENFYKEILKYDVKKLSARNSRAFLMFLLYLAITIICAYNIIWPYFYKQ